MSRMRHRPDQPQHDRLTGKKTAEQAEHAERQQYYDAFVQAQAALDSAQNAVTQAQVAYDSARQSEVTRSPQAEAALKAAQDDLNALRTRARATWPRRRQR